MNDSRGHNWLCVFTAVALCASTWACESHFARLQRQINEAQRSDATRLSRMKLPLYIEGEFEEPPPSVSVSLEPGRLILDNAQLLQARLTNMAALDRHAFFESAWETRQGSNPLVTVELPLPLDDVRRRELRGAAQRTREIEEHLRPPPRDAPTSVVIFATPDTPFRTVVEVADLLALEAPIRVVVARGGKTHTIKLNDPPACYTHLDIEDGQSRIIEPDRRALACMVPRLTLGERGITLEALAAPVQKARMVSRCGVHARHPDVPAPVNIFDQQNLLNSLSAALSHQWRTLPPCESAIVRANGNLAWGHVARLLQRLRAIGRHHGRVGSALPAMENFQLLLTD